MGGTAVTGFVKLMVVEDEPQVREEFRMAISKYQEMQLVYETDSEPQALDYLEMHPVDAVVLDIELREGDGVSFLNEIETRGLKKPFIIVVTNTGSQVTLRYLRAHGADYIYKKSNRTCSAERVLSVIEKLYPYQNAENYRKSVHVESLLHQENEDQIIRKYIENELEKLGFRRSQTGFRYIAEGIFQLMNDKEGQLQMFAEVYPLIAKKYHTTQEAVVSGIRNAIETVFKRAGIKNLQTYYPFDYDKEMGRPTNTEFMKHMAERLKL